ncbi:esterase [Shewanella sairae]|uniref:Esterase n=1 Tax=Shewanella sairae TaxID=190310 RepID=A0ABQ4PMJ3_9GAMM|nr:alpha/beta fold hydrolase [Shewanella sairae]MCL1129448.1 alpha/beta fold hydrolase [Shewanella sairae]GIU49489.1 esterase [Shewanella sairae]
MKTIIIGSTKHLAFAVFYSSVGTAIALVAMAVWYLNSRPDLSSWHTTDLTSEYNVRSEVNSFADYLALEDQLFAELDQKLHQNQTQPQYFDILNRYVKGSYSDPSYFSQDWNRSFEWPQANAEFGVILLHGMSDSPYAMSHFAKHYQKNAYVLGLRLPGHGTLPSALTRVSWQDMAGAVALATEHMKQVLGDKPLYVVGYSTGAALALNHELERINSNKERDYAAMVLLSPAIGLTPVAAGAKWQARLGLVLGLDKLSWNSIQSEYDPFKYGSFAVNAGDVVYRLSEHNLALINQLGKDRLTGLPPILTFQSLTDDTVDTRAVVERLYQKLPQAGHELVLFDINRNEVNLSLILNDPLLPFEPVLTQESFDYTFTLIENQSPKTKKIQARRINDSRVERLPLSWPKQVYSLSHVALPFPKSDPLYGPVGDDSKPHIQIGIAASRGERGVLTVPASEMMRQKWNPFHSYMLNKMDEVIVAQ